MNKSRLIVSLEPEMPRFLSTEDYFWQEFFFWPHRVSVDVIIRDAHNIAN